MIQTILALNHSDPETHLLRNNVKSLVQVHHMPQVCWGGKRWTNYLVGYNAFSPIKAVRWGES